MAAFVNRVFALPGKLASLDFIPMSKGTGAFIEAIGTGIFFVTLSSFAIWVFWTFFANLRVLRGDEPPGDQHAQEEQS
jgi:hypothetical protein